MAFVRHGSPEKIEQIGANSAETIVCRKCSRVLITAKAGAKIEFSGRGVSITCKCGEVNHGV